MKTLFLTLIFICAVSLDSVQSQHEPPEIRSEEELSQHRVGQILMGRGPLVLRVRISSRDDPHRYIGSSPEPCDPLIVRANQHGRPYLHLLSSDEKDVYHRIIYGNIRNHPIRDEDIYYIPPIHYDTNCYLLRKNNGVIKRYGEVMEVNGVLTMVKKKTVAHAQPKPVKVRWGDEFFCDRHNGSPTGLVSHEHIATYFENLWLPGRLLPPFFEEFDWGAMR